MKKILIAAALLLSLTGCGSPAVAAGPPKPTPSESPSVSDLATAIPRLDIAVTTCYPGGGTSGFSDTHDSLRVGVRDPEEARTLRCLLDYLDFPQSVVDQISSGAATPDDPQFPYQNPQFAYQGGISLKWSWLSGNGNIVGDFVFRQASAAPAVGALPTDSPAPEVTTPVPDASMPPYVESPYTPGPGEVGATP